MISSRFQLVCFCLLFLTICCGLQAFQPTRTSRYFDWRRSRHRPLSSSTDDPNTDPFDTFSTFDKILFARFSASVAAEMGTGSSPRNYGQLMDLINQMTTTRPTTMVHDQGKNMLVRLFPKWLLEQYQWMFAAPFPRFSAWMNAYVTHWTTNWLMGNSTVCTMHLACLYCIVSSVRFIMLVCTIGIDSSFLVPRFIAVFLLFSFYDCSLDPDLRLGTVRRYHSPTTRTVSRKMSIFRVQWMCTNMFACLQSAYPTLLSRGNGVASNVTTKHDRFKVSVPSCTLLFYHRGRRCLWWLIICSSTLLTYSILCLCLLQLFCFLCSYSCRFEFGVKPVPLGKK